MTIDYSRSRDFERAHGKIDEQRLALTIGQLADTARRHQRDGLNPTYVDKLLLELLAEENILIATVAMAADRRRPIAARIANEWLVDPKRKPEKIDPPKRSDRHGINPKHLQVGLLVRYHPDPERAHDGRMYTIAEIRMVGAGKPLVWLEGKAGGVMLDQLSLPVIEVIEPDTKTRTPRLRAA